MRWVDVAGAPGTGKSTLVDRLWPPRCIKFDGKPHPEEWNKFLMVVDRLLKRVQGHPSFNACKSMVNRSFKKIATVSRMKDDRVYIQTGLVQRGLGIGWRLKDQEEIAPFFETMPLSLGVAILHAPVELVQKRNVDRNKDRSYMVPLMERPRQIAVEILRDRVPLLELDTTKPINDNIKELLTFADSASRLAHP